MIVDKEKGSASCNTCGQNFFRKRYLLIAAERHFCNRTCKNNYRYGLEEKVQVGWAQDTVDAYKAVGGALRDLKPKRMREIRAISGTSPYKARSLLTNLVKNRCVTVEKRGTLNYYALTKEGLEKLSKLNIS